MAFAWPRFPESAPRKGKLTSGNRLFCIHPAQLSGPRGVRQPVCGDVSFLCRIVWFDRRLRGTAWSCLRHPDSSRSRRQSTRSQSSGHADVQPAAGTLCDATAARSALLARLVHDPQLHARQPLPKLWLRLRARTLWFQLLHGLLSGFLVGVLILVLAEWALSPRVAKFSRHPANNAVDLKTWFLDWPSGMVFRFIVPTPG